MSEPLEEGGSARQRLQVTVEHAGAGCFIGLLELLAETAQPRLGVVGLESVCAGSEVDGMSVDAPARQASSEHGAVGVEQQRRHDVGEGEATADL